MSLQHKGWTYSCKSSRQSLSHRGLFVVTINLCFLDPLDVCFGCWTWQQMNKTRKCSSLTLFEQRGFSSISSSSLTLSFGYQTSKLNASHGVQTHNSKYQTVLQLPVLSHLWSWSYSLCLWVFPLGMCRTTKYGWTPRPQNFWMVLLIERLFHITSMTCKTVTTFPQKLCDPHSSWVCNQTAQGVYVLRLRL